MDKTHIYGRIWTLTALFLFIMIPVSFSAYLNAWPSLSVFLKGLAPIAVIFYPTAIIEVLTYTPLMGSGATYLAFVTGNISNLKLPCTLSALETNKISANSQQGEIISTIAVASSSIVTTLIIAIGILLLSPIIPLITDEGSVLYPAFKQIVPCLFGALGATYFAKHWKISILPIAVLIIALLFYPTAQIGVLIPAGVIVSLTGAHFMYKAGLIGTKEEREKIKEENRLKKLQKKEEKNKK